MIGQGAARELPAFMPVKIGEVPTSQPTRRLLVAAAVASLGLTLIQRLLETIPLPFDGQYHGVLYLMWPGGYDGLTAIVAPAFNSAGLILPLAVLVSAALPKRVLSNPPRPLRWMYEYAVVLPLVRFAVFDLSRVVSNVLYAAAFRAPADQTPAIARLESGLILHFQLAADAQIVSQAASILYSSVWLVALLMAVPLLLAVGRNQAASRLLVGLMLAPFIALPFFLFIPVFEPWALNPVYGYGGPSPTAIRFLAVPGVSPQLASIVSSSTWSTGACLPSLHVALPALVSRMCFLARARLLGWAYGLLAGVTGLAVVYLGRHWIVDVVLAVPFVFGIAWLVQRFNPNVVLEWSAGRKEVAQ